MSAQSQWYNYTLRLESNEFCQNPAISKANQMQKNYNEKIITREASECFFHFIEIIDQNKQNNGRAG